MVAVKITKELERRARVFALFGDVTRLSIMRFLIRTSSANVTDIAQEVNMSVACVSHHLQLLKDNHVLESKRQGTSIIYTLSKDPLIKSLQTLIIK